MRGWIAGLMNWSPEDPEDLSSQVWLREFTEQMATEDVTTIQKNIVQWLQLKPTSPRLRAFLESGRVDVSATIWAIFTDPGG